MGANMEKLLWILLAAVNLGGFLVCGWDKLAAKRGWRRVRERTLFLWAGLWGGPGVLAGMYLFRHKTRHLSFVIGVTLLIVAYYGGLWLLWQLWERVF